MIVPPSSSLDAPFGAPTPLSCRGGAIGRGKKGGFLNFSRPFLAPSRDPSGRGGEFSPPAAPIRHSRLVYGNSDCQRVKHHFRPTIILHCKIRLDTFVHRNI